ncbi:MAG: Ni/Fe hydrogenase [Flavobacteriia bacterium]|nr:MAG: Ni/Fe hydrogenase [Flavobacteriia bacterium]
MLKEVKHKGIVLGIGNKGRQDDGLGWLFLDHIKSKGFNKYDLEYRYQLQIEDAELISRYQNVLFVDASKEKIEEGFYTKTCRPSEKYSFSTHELMPETILYLAKKLYHAQPVAKILAIKGYQWNLKNGITKKAMTNLKKAEEFFIELYDPELMKID